MTELVNGGQSPFDALKRVEDGREFWLGRELMPHIDYDKWQNFQRAINDARSIMSEKGYDLSQHFSLAPVKTPDQEKRVGRPSTDWRLSRMACRFVLMSCDNRKSEIRSALQYFAEQTDFAEKVQQAVQTLPPVPRTFQEALRAYADEIDAREKAELQAAEAKAEAEMLRPPAEAWQTLVDTGQDYSMAEAAAILNRDPVIDTGQNRLRDWMLKHRMMYRRGRGQLVPYHEHLPHIRLKPQTRPNHDPGDPQLRKEANSQVRITVSGLEWIQRRMREENKPVLIPAQRQPERVPEVAKPTDIQVFQREKYERLRALYGH